MNSIDLEFILIVSISICIVFILVEKINIIKESKIFFWFSKESKSFLLILIIVLFLRSFLAEPFRIPSGSMLPTLLIGDFILVNKYEYGIRLPITKKKIFEISEPKNGDIIVFRYPKNEKINFIKRVIGVPGDKILYRNKILIINNKPLKHIKKLDHKYLNEFLFPEIEMFTESNNGKFYQVLSNKYRPSYTFEITVPKGKYFVMGDNRDHSSDSRYWGYVPQENLVGRAFMVWMSFDFSNFSFKFDRIGNLIK